MKKNLVLKRICIGAGTIVLVLSQYASAFSEKLTYPYERVSYQNEVSYYASTDDILTPLSSELNATSQSLPVSVDNSDNDWFPPIIRQFTQECVYTASTYYQMTYMVARKKNWNTKNPNDYQTKFSPRFTYNVGEKYKYGTLLMSDFPYDESNKNWYELPTTSDMWQKAMKYKVTNTSSIDIPNVDTPISDENSEVLIQIKSLLNDGHVLAFGTPDIDRWIYTTVDNSKNPEKPDLICYMLDRISAPYGHEMVIVGYDDSIEYTINGRFGGTAKGKGAFKIANSAGADWKNKGFVWVAYDALNRVSALDMSQLQGQPTSRVPLFKEVSWINDVITDYTPELIAEFTVNHHDRNQLHVDIGYSIKGDSEAVIYNKFHVNKPPREDDVRCTYDGTVFDETFDGNNDPQYDATIAIDLTDILSQFNNKEVRWFLRISDSQKDNFSGELKSFKIIDNVTEREIKSNDVSHQSPIVVNGSTEEIFIDYTRSVSSSSPWTLLKGNPIGRNRAAYAYMNNTLYVIGGMALNNNSKPDLVNWVNAYEYDEPTSTWSSEINIPNTLNVYSDPKAHVVDDKLYIVGSQASTTSIDEFDTNSSVKAWKNSAKLMNFWLEDSCVVGDLIFVTDRNEIKKYSTKTKAFDNLPNLPINDSYKINKLSTANNKLYALLGHTDIWEYDILSNSWSRKSDIKYSSNFYRLVSFNDKIYIFTGPESKLVSENKRINKPVIQEYNPKNDSWTVHYNMIDFTDRFIHTYTNFNLIPTDDKILLMSNIDPTNPDLNTFLAFYTPEQKKMVMLGDTTFDGEINSTDLVKLRRYIIEILKFTNPEEEKLFLKAADLNGDGDVDSTDYIILKRYLLEIKVNFPIGEMIEVS